jgi:biotin carboxylase
MSRRLKNLVILGGGHADIPLIKAGRALGFSVITSGNRPSDLGHAQGDFYAPADFSNRHAVLQIAKEHGISAICPACNDFSALSAAYVAEEMGLPGHDSVKVTKTVHHKDLFRMFSLKHGFTVPRARGFTDKMEAIEFVKLLKTPALVKPVDLTGGKGISCVESASDLERAVEFALKKSKTNRFVIEEFIEGSRHGFSAFLVGGRVVFSFADNEYYHLNPYLVAGAVTPSSAPQSSLERLTGEIERYADLLKLKDGIFHVQFILRGDEPVIIECCRRAPGDLYLKFVEHATSCNYAEYVVRAAAGLDCSGIKQREIPGSYVRHCIMPSQRGRVRNVTIDESLKPHLIDQLMWWAPGDEIVDLLTHKCGIIFLKFDTAVQMQQALSQIHELIKVETEA